MIGKGAQYLTAAGFGRYRITAASLGSLDLLGTCWLRDATMQAIMAAFGVDGPAVIAATNEYLNGIAASDKAKATALAGFINEDPMMVCSLGLEPQGVTMPERKIISVNNAWSDFSDLVIQAPVTCDIKFLMKSVSGDKVMVAIGNFRWMTIDGSRWCVANSSYVTISSPTPQADVEYTNKIDVSTTQSKTYINGTLVYTGGVPPTRTGVKLFRNDGTNTSSWAASGSYFYYIHGYNDNGDVAWFVPFVKNGVNGILEIVSGTWKGNENTSANSSYTISYTRNGTPWTPSTP